KRQGAAKTDCRTTDLCNDGLLEIEQARLDTTVRPNRDSVYRQITVLSEDPRDVTATREGSGRTCENDHIASIVAVQVGKDRSEPLVNLVIDGVLRFWT